MACRAAVPRLPFRPKISASPVLSFPFRSVFFPSHSLRGFTLVNKLALRCQVHSEAKLEADTQLNQDTGSTWKIKMLYDGDCPLCMREVNMLKERNRRYNTIKFVDISSMDYSPEQNQGLDYRTVMGRIHAILSDGTVVRDVENLSNILLDPYHVTQEFISAFRRLYEEVELGWIYSITKYKPMAAIANAIYSVWAKYRLQITGRPPLDDILELRKKKTAEACTDDKVCKM